MLSICEHIQVLKVYCIVKVSLYIYATQPAISFECIFLRSHLSPHFLSYHFHDSRLGKSKNIYIAILY